MMSPRGTANNNETALNGIVPCKSTIKSLSVGRWFFLRAMLVNNLLKISRKARERADDDDGDAKQCKN